MSRTQHAEWTLAATHPRQESTAAENCLARGVHTLLPRYREDVVSGGEVVKKIRVLFPSYLFARIDGDVTFASLRNTRGVARVITIAGEPVRCRADVVDALQARMDDDGCVELEKLPGCEPIRFVPYQRLKVVDAEHPLFGMLGVCMGMTIRQRVRLLMNMMGRKVRIELSDRALVAV